MKYKIKIKLWKLLTLVVILLFLNFSCAGNIYNMDQIKKNKGVTKKIIDKKAFVYKKSGDVVVGYIKEIRPDSVFVSAKKKNSDLIAIATQNIKTIKIKNQKEKKVLYIIPIAITLYLLNKVFGGPSSISLD